MTPTPGSVWRDTETGEVVKVESFDGAYAVVIGEHHSLGCGVNDRGEPVFLVQPGHFGKMYTLEQL